MSGIAERQREILEEFINIYRNEPCIWNIKSKNYHNRDKKTAAYNKLIEQYQKIEPNADRDIVVKKVNALRTNYRKERKKVEESIRYAEDANDVYVPTLWYYELLTFLDEDQGSPTCSQDSELDLEDKDDKYLVIDDISEPTPRRSRPLKRKATGSRNLSNKVLRSVNEYFKRPVLKEDRFDIFGKNVAMKLRDLRGDQRIIAEKIINDTLFEAEMGNLVLPKQEFIYKEYIHSNPLTDEDPDE